ncbi:YaaA family protein [Dermatobacter hominis]|uniref:YaaA family protein n=1 Tax=Dermatobacter hominis TaxID=2884263 RepID=UPI001D0FD47E|nr:peroxide stress protein YaaA [Dermatobacter hominis]UDY35668.1 peroxide stress protein YaaA [Dermatobacter hominis]
MPSSSLILIPPSEGKAPGGGGPPWTPGTMAVDLDHRRERVMAALRSAMRRNAAERGRLLGVKGEALAAATEANRSIATSPTMPAAERFTGVLYDALSLSTLAADARARADGSLLVLSGVFGLVAPSDPIPDHKLKMSVSIGRLGKLSTWWRDAVSAELAERAAGRTVWNLLPNEHAAAVALAGVAQTTVTFLEPGRDGQLVAVAHWNKLLKGSLVRHLLEQPGTAPDDLADWDHPEGFRLDPRRTVVDGSTTTLSLVRR